MNKKSGTSKDAADKLVRGIKRKTRMKAMHLDELVAAMVCVNGCISNRQGAQVALKRY